MSPSRTSSRTLGAVFVAATALGALGLVGCGNTNTTTAASNGSADPATTSRVRTGATSGGSTDSSASDGGNAADGNGGGGDGAGGNGGGGGGNNGGGGNGGGGGASGPTPTINSFTTPENIDCHNGNLKTFSASWTTSNAVKTTISIDGPGIFKTYGPNGEDSFPFNCSSSHTFLLTAIGSGGKTATKSVTLQPRNVQKPPTPDPEDPPASSTTTAKPAPSTTKAPAPTTTVKP